MVGVISLLWLGLANNRRVGVFPDLVRWDLVVRNEEEGDALDVLALIGTGANVFA
jgi:hypothetical protein